MPLVNMMGSIQSGFGSVADSTQRKASASTIATCSGDTCDFGVYQSLGVCGACSSGSLPIDLSDGYYVLRTMDDVDLSLNAIEGQVNLTADGSYPVSSDLKEQVGPLLVRSVAFLRSRFANSTVVAKECAAWWCVKTYASTMTNGTLHEEMREERTDRSPGARTTGDSQQDSIDLYPPTCPINPSDQSAVPKSCDFFVGAESHRAIQNFFISNNPNLFSSPFFTGSVTMDWNTSNVTSLPVAALLEPSNFDGDIGAVFDEAFTSMLRYMTVSLRDQPTYGPDYPGWVYGKAFTRETAFEVNWAWLSYPIIVVAASIAFLALTIVLNRHDEIWKSSVLAIMFHSFADDDRRALGDLNTTQAMRAATRDQKVQMEKQDPGGQWVFRTRAGKPKTHAEAKKMVGSGASRIFGHGSEFAREFLSDRD
ncbi:uncharacterized protein LTR77_007143 [Saxophila tyrrhenica]|uniref:Uncharacterized protein n=1 Tax=Saxophila tyrrhenica TaxID=1690608 RepID=A0AAV9P3R9_9PEZI|nr:hypothetical protein LTR77_007143 [Saxophila tyrrhenica]